MASHPGHLRLVSGTDGDDACRSRACDLASQRGERHCGPCLAAFAAAEELYRRLLAREMARLERRSPGIGRCARAALRERLAQDDTQMDADARPPLFADWELTRITEFVAELRAGSTGAGAA